MHPKPVESWGSQTKLQYIQEYEKQYIELSHKGLKSDLSAWMYGISILAITAVAVTAFVALAASFAAIAGAVAFIIVSSLALGTIGITAGVVIGIWLGSQSEVYRNQKNILNTTLQLKWLNDGCIDLTK